VGDSQDSSTKATGLRERLARDPVTLDRLLDLVAHVGDPNDPDHLGEKDLAQDWEEIRRRLRRPHAPLLAVQGVSSDERHARRYVTSRDHEVRIHRPEERMDDQQVRIPEDAEEACESREKPPTDASQPEPSAGHAVTGKDELEKP